MTVFMLFFIFCVVFLTVVAVYGQVDDTTVGYFLGNGFCSRSKNRARNLKPRHPTQHSVTLISSTTEYE